MVRQLRNEMRRCEFCGELFLPRLRPLAIDELEEIESDPNTLHADQVRDVLDVIDVTIECAFFFSRANEDGVDADDAAKRRKHTRSLRRSHRAHRELDRSEEHTSELQSRQYFVRRRL